MAGRRPAVMGRKPREVDRTIYTDWANQHLERTGVKRLIQDLPSDISDGVILADVVHFVCGEQVQLVHSRPRSTKQKVDNINRCLQVLHSHNVTLNDVTTQGLCRGELKSVLALFFHLSRHKRNEADMSDVTKSAPKRGLRPPSSVGRRSRSFNANDRNRVTPEPHTTVSEAAGIPQSRASAPVASTSVTGWRSKSMNVKHTTTTRLVAPKSHAPTLQTFKPDRPLSANAPSVMSQSSESQSIVSSDRDKRKSQLSNVVRRTQPAPSKTASSRPEMKPSNVGKSLTRKKEDRSKPSLVRPSTTGKRSGAVVKTISSNQSSAKGSLGVKHSQDGGKPVSMMSRLRKLGTTTSSGSSTTSSKPRSTSASKNTVNSLTSSSASSNLKKRAESCPPTSRLGTARLSSLQGVQARLKAPSSDQHNKKRAGKLVAEKSNLKSPSGLKSVKSSIGRAFGGAKQNEKKKPTGSPASLPGLFNKPAPKRAVISKSEIRPIIPMFSDEGDSPPVTVISQSESPPEETRDLISPPSLEEDSRNNEPEVVGVQESDELYETPVEPVSIASPRVVNKTHKTATVSPFYRQPAPIRNDPEKNPKNGNSPATPPPDRESPELTETSHKNSPSTPAESREKAVKGIADLRQNLEETMSSLRNTQLRHRQGDAFQRRISAQLEGGDFDETSPSLHEVPLSCSSSIYRSHHNLITGRSSMRTLTSFGSSSPRLHAGETLGHADYKLGPGQFSSLQRTRSARYPRTAWRDVTAGYVSEGDVIAPMRDQKSGYVSDGAILDDDKLEAGTQDPSLESFDDASSVSSDISDRIADVSTDEVSSCNDSPHHQMKTPLTKAPSWGKLGSGLSKSTVAIDSSSKSLKFTKKKGLGKPPSGKSGLQAPGSALVGSRLASNSTTCSPSTGSPLSGGVRGTLCYRSLPRPNKSKMNDDLRSRSITSSQATSVDAGANGEKTSLRRSPSLQRLLGLGKPKQVSDQSTADTSAVVLSNPHVTSPNSRGTIHHTVSPVRSDGSGCSNIDPSSPSRRGLGHYNSLRRPGKSTRGDTLSTSALSYLSLPRPGRSPAGTKPPATDPCTNSGVMTWSPKRPNANSAYSVSPPQSNPFMSLDLLSSPTLCLGESDPAHAEEFLKKATRGGVSDWPLPTLHTSSSIARSIPNMNKVESLTKPYDVTNNDVKAGSLTKRNESGRSFPGRRSMMSSTPSLYSLAEDNVVPMKSTLDSLKCDNNALKSHLSSNAQVVNAFEDSLSCMNDRLKQLSVSAEEKDSELQELRATIETLKRNQSPDEWSSGSSGLKKKASCGSLSSITSSMSVGSTEDGLKKRKKHWLKESIKTAFGRRKSRPNLNGELEVHEGGKIEEEDESEVVTQLKEELLRKERKLTDIRLEALTSQHQLHQMQDAMHRMRSEMETLRQENERLSRLGLSPHNRDVSSPNNHNFIPRYRDPTMVNGDVRMKVTVEYPQHVIHNDTDERSDNQTTLGFCLVARPITWQQLDKKIQTLFETFCQRIDPTSGLGLCSAAITSYKIGEAVRHVGGEAPELLPCGYIIGNVDTIVVRLRDGSEGSLESLALELLIDHETMKRYAQLVLDHGRVMLCGPAGTGKSSLANRLAEHVVRRIPKASGRGAIVRLDLKHRSENDVAEYLHQLSEDCSKPESCGREIPVILVLDDVHRSSRLREAFLPLLTTAAHSQLPYLIGVAQQNCASGLDLHQEFRWILCSTHSPPVSTFLERSLKRYLLSSSNPDDVMNRVVEWIPRCWRHVNKCIETHNSADVTLGPRIFASCPMDVTSAKTWFTDLWNFSVIPYIISAVKQGSKTNTNQWTDPTQWVKESWPWPDSCELLSIRPEDVAVESKQSDEIIAPSVTSQGGDPLLNMLMKLQEAASNYESDASHDDTFERSLDRALGDLS
ncbi:neuron navigator 3-like isoform X2 [Clavelina lepadiformis]|uniref:neuron navigator 3-like isoform X2 n=1 Tax=Clavelina lepadiformis TaxID=159417 RepID=UPI00404315C1